MDEADGVGAGMDVDQDEDDARTVRRRGSTWDRDQGNDAAACGTVLGSRGSVDVAGAIAGTTSVHRAECGHDTEEIPWQFWKSTTIAAAFAKVDRERCERRTSTGRESPVPPPVTNAVVADSAPSRTADEEVAKKVRLDGTLSSLAKGKQRMDVSEDLAGSTDAAQTADEEKLAQQRLENVDPHNCGFTVWQDVNGAGPSSSKKNRKALAWLTIPFDNQENTKPPPTNVMVPFVMDTGGKGNAIGPSGSTKSSASTSAASTSAASSSSTTPFTTTSAISAAPPIMASAILPRNTAISARSSPVAGQNPRMETSIRSTMRGSIAPISTGGGLRGLECASPVRAATTPSHTTDSREGSPTPTLKLRRTTTSLTTSRSFPPSSNGTTTVPARPILVLRRTGSAENVHTAAANSPTSRTSTESALEQENAAITVSMVNDDTKEKNSGEEKVVGDGRKGRTGRKKRKSGEMADSPSEVQSDVVNKKPPTRSTTASTPASAILQDRPQGRRTRRSLGDTTGNEKKSASAGNGKKGTENGYKGRVLRSMTRAGNGL
ncbi:hypothetical protein QFC20_007164 [Naganishia adeliensis]|uniref:Uncharacterized protein n=1 Tax=Naganishia adeliensis TaxID=92952 RepID=A0ACC2V2S6_9TREE|nr:hypothetical protein QFC20_007164 [Naganishia adeliensis]